MPVVVVVVMMMMINHLPTVFVAGLRSYNFCDI